MTDLDTLAAKLKSLGAPGDHGYGTPAGDAIFIAHQILATVRGTMPTPGVKAIADERRRQIEEEGWTVEHDDGHTDDTLCLVAALYASPMPLFCAERGEGYFMFEDPWPSSWDREFDRRQDFDRRRLLEIAGALIAADIDRLDRAQAKAT